MWGANSTLSFESLYHGGVTRDAPASMNPSPAASTGLGHLATATGGRVSQALGLELPVLIGFLVLAVVLVRVY